MATDLHRVKPAAAARKHEAFVERQLARARARIRYLDLAAAALGLVILTLAYGLVLALCDRWLELPALARQIAFALYAAGGLVYLGLLVLRPLWRPINPYYAARRLERAIPEAKNSVINWLDLHQQAIAPAFRNAIGQQAAKDLAEADLEQAISARRTSWLGAGAAALFIGMLILFVLGRDQFLSLMSRAFAPFVDASIATRTRILLEQPEGGDVTKMIGRGVDFSVWVEGRVPATSSPEALRLLYRYNPSDPYQTRLLERGDSSRRWFTQLSASEVHNGFWYKMAGGDAETAEYRIGVRSTPLLTGFDVTYRYRSYLGWPERTTHDQNLQDLRGTDVTLLARTNRTVKDGQLVIERQKPIAAELVPEDSQALIFRLRLEQDGTYRIWFRSVEDESNTDPMAYTIRVLQDHPPQVELTKPGEDGELPGNGVLHLEGSASDDFGIASLNLRMKIDNREPLQPKPYRKGATLRRGDGSYPQMLAYRDFVELNKLQKEDGQALEPLPVGAKVEYWLEAADNCDYPGPNIGESKHFTITIRAADANQKKQEQDRQQARQEQQKHEKKQDQDLQNQKSDARDRAQEQNPRPANADQQNKEHSQQNEDELSKQKEKIENAIKENEQQQKARGEKGESKQGQSQESNGEGKGEASSDGQVDKAQGKGKEGGEAKQQPGQEKSGGKAEGNTEKGQQKGAGQTGPKSEENRENQPGQQGTERTEPASNQNSGANQPGKNPQRQPKPSGDGQTQDQAAPQSGNGEKSTKPDSQNPNTRKPQNPGESQEKAGTEKTEKKGAGQGGHKQETAQSKGQEGAEAAKTPGTTREQQPKGNPAGSNMKQDAPVEKAEKKGPGQDGSKQDAGKPKGEEKQEANAANTQKQNPNQQAGNQQGSEKKDNSNSGQRSEPRAGEKQGESKADKQANPQQDRADRGQGDRTKPKAAGKENPNGGARESAAKAQEKSAGPDKGEAGARGTAKSDYKENSQNPAARGAQGTDKAEDKEKAGSVLRQDDQPQQSKPERPAATQAGEKSQDDVSALSEALKGRDENARANARKRLEELRDKAPDQSVRRAAADALEQARRDNAGRPEQKSSGSKSSAEKDRSEAQPTGKSEPKNADRTKPQGDSASAPGERGNQAPSSKKPGGSGASSGTGGNEPTEQQPRPNGSPDARPDRAPDPMEPPTPANAAYQKRAGELQLEDIKKKINKDVLKQLNMTDEDFQKFAKAYEEMLKRKQPSALEKENAAVPQRGNRSLPNQNVRFVDPRDQGKDGKLQRLGPSLAPPEFREAYKQFSKHISELEQSKEKK